METRGFSIGKSIFFDDFLITLKKALGDNLYVYIIC